jgi:hypothetical protein
MCYFLLQVAEMTGRLKRMERAEGGGSRMSAGRHFWEAAAWMT